MDKQYHNSNFASEKYLQNTIKYVLNEVFNLLKVCYGPYGSHVLIANKIGAEAMKDGQRILSSYITDGSIGKSVLQSIKSVSNKQAEEVGDGTTTTILLLCQLYNEFRQIIIESGVSPSIFLSKVEKVVSNIISEMDKYVINVLDPETGEIDWDLLSAAIYTSVDANTSLTNVIVDMFKEMDSTDPLIIVDTNTTNRHYYELVKGVELDGAPLAPEVFFNGYSRKNVNTPIVVMINGRLELSSDFILQLDDDAMRNNNDYIFLCSGMNDDILSTLVQLKSVSPTVLNRVTFFQTNLTNMSDEFLDTCALLGTTPIDSETLKKVSSYPALLKILQANASVSEKALITEFCVRFNDPDSNVERLNERIAQIDSILENRESYDGPVKELENRRAILNKNFAKLYVGGNSPQRRSINYELAKDGVLQATSCLKNGVIFGANSTVFRVTDSLISSLKITSDEETVYGKIASAIHDAYGKLYYTLVENKIGDHNYDADTHRLMYGDFNIRDDAEMHKVVNSAYTDVVILNNASDMAALLATSKAFLSTSPEFDGLLNG